MRVRTASLVVRAERRQSHSMFVFDISTRFACSTLLYRSYSLEEALDGIAQSDVGYVDIWAVPDVLAHVDPAGDDPASVEAKLAERGLRASSVTVYGASGDDMVRRMGFAGGIGAETVITTAPPCDYDRREATDDVRALGRAAQEAGVTLCLTNCAGTWMDTAEAVAGFLDDVGHPRVQLSLGPPHAYVCGVSLEAIVAAAGNRVGQAYLWSVATGAQSADELGDGDDQTPGNGEIDFRAMTRLLEERNYHGMFTFMWHGTEGWSRERIGESLARAKAHVLAASKAG